MKKTLKYTKKNVLPGKGTSKKGDNTLLADAARCANKADFGLKKIKRPS